MKLNDYKIIERNFTLKMIVLFMYYFILFDMLIYIYNYIYIYT
jgi:hypothetical protein